MGKDRPRFGRPNRTETVDLSKWALTVSIKIRLSPPRAFVLGPNRKKKEIRHSAILFSALRFDRNLAFDIRQSALGLRIDIRHSFAKIARGNRSGNRFWKFHFCLQNQVYHFTSLSFPPVPLFLSSREDLVS